MKINYIYQRHEIFIITMYCSFEYSYALELIAGESR